MGQSCSVISVCPRLCLSAKTHPVLLSSLWPERGSYPAWATAFRMSLRTDLDTAVLDARARATNDLGTWSHHSASRLCETGETGLEKAAVMIRDQGRGV